MHTEALPCCEILEETNHGDAVVLVGCTHDHLSPFFLKQHLGQQLETLVRGADIEANSHVFKVSEILQRCVKRLVQDGGIKPQSLFRGEIEKGPGNFHGLVRGAGVELDHLLFIPFQVAPHSHERLV